MSFAENHTGSRDVAVRLADHPDVDEVSFIDNSKGKSERRFMTLDEVRQLKYDDIKSKLLEATKDLFDNGKISKEQYESLIK